MPYPKPCKRCGKKFQPSGRSSKICGLCTRSGLRRGERERLQEKGLL